MIENYLPLAYLNAWEYCPRRFYLEYVLGEMEDNEHIILGRHLHRNINEELVITEGDTVIRQQQWVWSVGVARRRHRLKIAGIIDAVEECNSQLIPVEYKKGKMAQHLNDHFQLCPPLTIPKNVNHAACKKFVYLLKSKHSEKK